MGNILRVRADDFVDILPEPNNSSQECWRSSTFTVSFPPLDPDESWRSYPSPSWLHNIHTFAPVSQSWRTPLYYTYNGYRTPCKHSFFVDFSCITLLEDIEQWWKASWWCWCKQSWKIVFPWKQWIWEKSGQSGKQTRETVRCLSGITEMWWESYEKYRNGKIAQKNFLIENSRKSGWIPWWGIKKQRVYGGFMSSSVPNPTRDFHSRVIALLAPIQSSRILL